jgi:hypothetical protein
MIPVQAGLNATPMTPNSQTRNPVISNGPGTLPHRQHSLDTAVTPYGGVMTEEHFPTAEHAPFSIVAISALLWSQGAIWAALAGVSLWLSAWLPANDLITAVLFGFTAWSCLLAVLLPRGSERARIWVIAQESFMTFLGLAIAGTWIFALHGQFGLAIAFLLAPIDLFIIFGIFMAACAAADLLFGPARGYCRPRTAL